MIFLTTYYTKNVDPQRKVYTPTDSYDKMLLPISANKHKYRTVVIHDGLSEEFTEKFSKDYPLVGFVKVDSNDVVGLNDVRYKHYATAMRHLKYMYDGMYILADCFDVCVNRKLDTDEFKDVDILASIEYQTKTGDCLWDESTPAGRWCMALSRSCIGGNVDSLYKKPIINAGVVMCSYDAGLEFCQRMYSLSKAFRYPDVSMFAANVIVPLMQKENKYSVKLAGSPFVSPFKEWDTDSKYFLSHK